MSQASPSPIDLRSDTVTRPDKDMYAAMVQAPLGDDVFGDDPTVRRLEERAAELLGKESALFVPSGTMANSIAIAVSTRPGDEVLIESLAHSLHFEVAGPSRLWGVQLTPLAGVRGAVPVEAIRGAVRGEDIHLPRTALLILEQTSNLSGGTVLPLEYLRRAGETCREKGLKLHMDGARIFNAEVASGVPARDLAACADTVMFCLSKGLGAPAGSILCGSSDAIREGRRVRKLLGGGMRQAGVLAACGLHALEHGITRLAEDHDRARAFARAIATAGLPVTVEPPETNMVYVRLEDPGPGGHARLAEKLRGSGVLSVAIMERAVRFVFHRDVPPDGTERAARVVIDALRTPEPRGT